VNNAVPPKKVKAVHSLTNTYSGVAAEIRAAAEFVRCGLKVSKPYWTDDEIDLLILMPEKTRLTPIPVQVKAIQFNPDAKTNKQPVRKPLQGLKKKYVERQLALCLVVYRPDTDHLWFFPSADAIRALYAKQYEEGIKEKKYDELDQEDDVPIAIELKPADAFNEQYLWTGKDRHWLTQKLFDLAHRLDRQHGLERLMETVFFTEEEIRAQSTLTTPLAAVPPQK
jgi:hypothetical protein